MIEEWDLDEFAAEFVVAVEDYLAKWAKVDEIVSQDVAGPDAQA